MNVKEIYNEDGHFRIIPEIGGIFINPIAGNEFSLKKSAIVEVSKTTNNDRVTITTTGQNRHIVLNPIFTSPPGLLINDLFNFIKDNL